MFGNFVKSLPPLLLIVVLAGHFSSSEAGRIESRPGAHLVENAGQHPDPVRYTLILDGATAWLTDDSVWLTYATREGEALAGIHLRLDFGAELAWKPYQAGGDEACIVFAGPSGAETLRPRTWVGARAALGDGAVLIVSEAGISITGDGRRVLAISVEGGPAQVRPEGGGSSIWVGAYKLPLRWEIPLIVNGAPAGDRGGPPTAVSAPTGGPQLHFSTFIGSESWDEGEAIKRDAAGNVYVAGQTLSIFFPSAPGPFSPMHNVEAFVARLNWQGTALDYLCVIRADVEDWGTALAVDAAGNAFLFGRTDSISNFPVTQGAYDTTPNGGFDLFVMKFDPAGQLILSTLIGGGEDEFAGDVAVAPDGTLILAGSTASDGSASAVFPTTAGAYKTAHGGGRDIFIAALSADGKELEYSTFVGGSGNDHAEALVLHGPAAVIGGWTASADFDSPAGGYDTVLDGNIDALVLSFTPGSMNLNFWTYLGGLDDGITSDRILAIDVDAVGKVYVSGSTFAADFPTTAGAFDPTFDDSCLCSDGFVAGLSSSGTDLLWATFLGAEGDDIVEALKLDGSGDLILAGTTGSAGFPVSGDTFDGWLDGGSDAFIARLDGSGAALPFATYLGGTANEAAASVAVTTGGWVLVTGWSDSPDFPTTPGSYDPFHFFDKDVFVTVLIPPGATAPAEEVFLPLVVR